MEILDFAARGFAAERMTPPHEAHSAAMSTANFMCESSILPNTRSEWAETEIFRHKRRYDSQRL